MSEKKQISISRNFIMNILLTMSSFVFPLISFPYISRVLLADGNGKVQMAVSFVAYFIQLAQLGIPTYGIRACAAVRDDKAKLTKTVHELIVIQFFATLISYAIFFVCIGSIPKLRSEKVLYLVVGTSVLLHSLGMEWLFRAMEEYTYITVRSIVFKIISVFAMFLLVHSREDYIIYAGITVFASAGSYLLNLARMNRYVLFSPVGSYEYKKHIKPVVVLFAYVCATTIYTNLDSVMLGFMTSDADVGYYSIIVKIKNILVSVVTSLGTVLLPRVSYHYGQGDFEKFWALAGRALRVVLLMAVPCVAFFIIFSKNCIFLLAGQGYAPSIVPLAFIMPTLIFIGMTSVTGIQILIPTGKENVIFWASVFGAVADVALNAVLIPLYRSTGAAIGTLVAEIIVFAVHYYVLRENLTPMFKNMRLWSVLIGTILASVSCFWVSSLGFGDFLTLLVATLIFFTVYGLFLIAVKDPDVFYVLKKIHLVKAKKETV